MSLIKRENSKNWYYLFQVNGKRYFGTTGTSNKKTASQVEMKIRNEIHRQRFLDEPVTITLGNALEKFRISKEGTPNYKNISVYENKLVGFKYHPKSGEKITVGQLADKNTPVHEIRTKDLLNYISIRKSEGLANWTIRHELQTLHATLKHVRSLGYMVNEFLEWPWGDLKVKKGKLRYLTLEEEKRLLEELNPNREGRGLKPVSKRPTKLQQQLQDNFDLVIALLDTGMRYSELVNLPWSAVSIAKGTISIYRSKVDSEDKLYMTDRLLSVMTRRNKTRAGTSRYVFESSDGTPRKYTPHSIQRAIERSGLNDNSVVKEKGDRVTIHTLRHTFASRLVQHGVNIAKVSKLLGHSSIRTTEIYSHLSQNEASVEAVNVLNILQTQ